MDDEDEIRLGHPAPERRCMIRNAPVSQCCCGTKGDLNMTDDLMQTAWPPCCPSGVRAGNEGSFPGISGIALVGIIKWQRCLG